MRIACFGPESDNCCAVCRDFGIQQANRIAKCVRVSLLIAGAKQRDFFSGEIYLAQLINTAKPAILQFPIASGRRPENKIVIPVQILGGCLLNRREICRVLAEQRLDFFCRLLRIAGCGTVKNTDACHVYL